jgi:5'(3')-deoxyribonucleotidase
MFPIIPLKEIVLCDLDGVVIDLMPGWLARYNRDFNDTLEVSQITDWDMKKFVKPEASQAIYNYLHSHELYDDAPPIPGALEGIAELRRLGYRVVFATASNMHMAGRKLRWLSEHGVLQLQYGTTHPDYVELCDKSLLAGNGVAIIDDYSKNLRGFTKGEMQILFPAHHNVREARQTGIWYPDSWRGVVELLAIRVINNQATKNTSIQKLW